MPGWTEWPREWPSVTPEAEKDPYHFAPIKILNPDGKMSEIIEKKKRFVDV